MGFRKDFLWGGAVSAHQLEGAYDRDGKGLSIMDVVTSGDVNRRRRITGEILKGENYPNHEAIDFYDYYKEDIRCGNGIQVFPYKYCMDTYLPKW